MQSYSTEKRQLCKVMMHLSDLNTNNYMSSSEFDDQLLSHRPTSKFNRLSRVIFQDGSDQQFLQKRKQMIKTKIKNQFRKKVIQTTTTPHFNELIKSPPQSQIKQSNRLPPSRTNSEIQVRQLSTSNNHRQLYRQGQHRSVNDFIQRPLELLKCIHKKNISARSRSYNSSLSRRKSRFSSMRDREIKKSSAVAPTWKNNPQPFSDDLQPWRYQAQESHLQGPFYARKRLVFK